MTVSAILPPWRDMVCVNIMVQSEPTPDPRYPIKLGFSTQWMDVPQTLLVATGAKALDGLKITWPEAAVTNFNDPQQPPASLYDGSHGMVQSMDLCLTYKSGNTYELTVTGQAEFDEGFSIECEIPFTKISVQNDTTTHDDALPNWVRDRFGPTLPPGAWHVQSISSTDLHRYITPVTQ